jgi:hypothetical protein
VGTVICFKVGVEDAEVLAKEFHPEFKKEDLANLEKFRIYLRMAINGRPSKPFSARTLSPYWNLKKQISR